MEGEFRLCSEADAKSFLVELMRRASYISYEPRGTVIEEDDAACRCDWTRRDKRDGSLVIGTTMFWFSFTSDDRIRTVETIGAIHSIIPSHIPVQADLAKNERRAATAVLSSDGSGALS